MIIGLEKDAAAAHMHTGAREAAGPVTIGLTEDEGDPTHWLATDAELTAEQQASCEAGNLYVNVHTREHAPGEIRGQIELGGVEPLLYADIQTPPDAAFGPA